jgi:hypothetical protein
MAKRKPKTPKNIELLLQSLACGATIEMAARQAGLSRRTVDRRLADPKFRRNLSRLRADMVTRATGMLTAASMESVRTLLDLQKSGTPAVKLGAARSVLEFASKLREIVDIEERMRELEEELEALQGMANKREKQRRNRKEDSWDSE